MKDLSKYIIIGKINEQMVDKTNFNNFGDIYVSPGIIKHIQKHIDLFSEKEKEDILKTMIDICSNPDYIGEHPEKIGESLELIRKFDNNMLLAIEVDKKYKYNYVSSLYIISQGKVNNRINSKRISEYDNNFDINSKEIDELNVHNPEQNK